MVTSARTPRTKQRPQGAADAPETAAVEVGFFFPAMNVYSR